MAFISVTTTGLDDLARAFDESAQEIVHEVEKVTGKACRNMQLDARRRVTGLKHLPHLGRSFTYDVSSSGATVRGEVGAEHERLQGKLDVFLEYGSPTSAPHPHWAPAADKEIPVWERYVEEAAAKVLEG